MRGLLFALGGIKAPRDRIARSAFNEIGRLRTFARDKAPSVSTNSVPRLNTSFPAERNRSLPHRRSA